jgi:hypothetical protein
MEDERLMDLDGVGDGGAYHVYSGLYVEPSALYGCTSAP